MNPAEAVLPLRIGTDADRDAVTAFVNAHPEGTPFHLPAWIEAVEAGTGQRGHLLVATRGDRIEGVLPLTAMRSMLFGKALVSSGFAVGGGVMPTGEGWQHKLDSYAGFTRPLGADDEADLAAIPRKQRAEVRKALAVDMAVTVGLCATDRLAHYAVYAESVRNLGTPVFPRRLFAAVLDRFGENVDILTVWHEGEAVASVLSLYHRGVVMPYWGGGTLSLIHI